LQINEYILAKLIFFNLITIVKVTNTSTYVYLLLLVESVPGPIFTNSSPTQISAIRVDSICQLQCRSPRAASFSVSFPGRNESETESFPATTNGTESKTQYCEMATSVIRFTR